MSSVGISSLYRTHNITNPEQAEGSIARYHPHSNSTRRPPNRLNSQSSEYLGSTTSTHLRSSEIRSRRSFSSSIRDGDSIKSSSSLPTRPKASSDEWQFGMALKSLPKTFHEPSRRVSNESQRPARQGWEWIWVLEGNRAKLGSTEPLQIPKEELMPKRVRRSLPIRKTDGVYPLTLQDNSFDCHGKYLGNLSVSGVANPDDGTIRRPSTDSRGTRRSSEKSQRRRKLLRGLQYMSPTYPHFRSPAGEPEGLYCKTKRGIGGGLLGKPREDLFQHVLCSEEELPSRATATLKGVTSALGRSQLDPSHPTIQFSAGSRSPSTASQRPRRQIGIAPWHRRNSQDSTWSVTSSIRDVLRGKTPASTPNPEMQYGGHKGKKYAKEMTRLLVDITRREEPTFLPSEAIRVQTPPESSVRIANTYSHGFPLDPIHSGDDRDSTAVPGHGALFPTTTPRSAMKAHITSPGNREWWDNMETRLEIDAPVIKALIEPAIRGQIEHPRFEWNTPAHLPNSPLCPLFQDEKQGESGDDSRSCVYHGWK